MATSNLIEIDFIANETKNIDMWAVGAAGRATKHTLIVDHATTGAVAGVLNIFRGTKYVNAAEVEVIVYDTTAAATITVSGTDLACESVSFEIAGNEYWRGVLSGLSASSTGHWIIAYADRA